MNKRWIYFALLPLLAIIVVIASLRFATVFIPLTIALVLFSFVLYKAVKFAKSLLEKEKAKS